MPNVAVYNMQGAQVGEIELNSDVFGVEVNQTVLHSAVVLQLASLRRGTHSTKLRGEVSGGGRKPWRQKGTGRARAGSIRSPLWRGGAILFGPKPRDYGFSMPKKQRRLALKSALSSKVESGKLIVLDELNFDAPKSKQVVELLNNLKVSGKVLVVTGEFNETVEKSARNIAGVAALEASGLNVYDILHHDTLVVTKAAVAKVEEVLA
ncbi:MAG TPA: 50S ribosomal protein L4 [Candidatus Deferrimicrobium sp.]|jgi:large subunit ribosomal protein L4|nr:50S ribosomal protein L4 [Candidatus Deferrimicrobium sp.]